MDMDFITMTDDELIELRQEIDSILANRREAEKKRAIENFEKAFKELKKYVWEVHAEDNEYEIIIDDFKQFYFED